MSSAVITQDLASRGVGFPGFFRSAAEWDDVREVRPHRHQLQRAWDALGLAAVLCCEGKPTVFFKTVARADLKAEAEWQKLLWNQSLAAMLVVEDPTKTRIYSALAKPAASPVTDDDTRLADILETAAFALEFRQFLFSVQTGKFYVDRADRFRADNAVDQYLLKNLSYARELLMSEEHDDRLTPKTANAFLGRCLFTCYLIERGVIGEAQLQHVGAVVTPNLHRAIESLKDSAALEVLFRLFRLLDDDFNGSMFGTDFAAEKAKITPRHISILRRLLRGDDLEADQPGLFDRYDFRFIPIELISAIYERFIGGAQKNQRKGAKSQQRSAGSYYTPPRLAELVVDIATEAWDTLLDKRCLDPACGSGIFLVILFQRMAAEWCRNHPHAGNVERARELRKLLTNNLVGVDVDPTACMVACFSLYLAFLDQLKPRDIWDLKDALHAKAEGKVLPPLHAGPPDGQSGCPVILESNFFGRGADCLGQFHLVIGNPPWTGRNQPVDKEMRSWLFSRTRNPFFETTPRNKSEKLARFFPQKQSAIGYMWKVPLHLRDDGVACLLLPSRVILSNQTDKFQAEWFRRFGVQSVWQLADYSFILFKEADCPAIVAKFTNASPDRTEAEFAYYTPKVEQIDPRHASVVVSADERKILSLAELLAAANEDRAYMFWKTAFWGTDRDRRLLDRLKSFATLSQIAGEPKEKKRWVKGQGFQPARASATHPKPVFWKDDDLFLDANNESFGVVLSADDCEAIGSQFQALHRPRSRKVYIAPLVLVNQGCSRFAFSDFDVLFTASLQSIAGQRKDEELLLFLTALLNSPLATYYLFHTSANWGVERDKVHFEELMALPFPLPEQTKDPAASLEIVRRVAVRLRRARTEMAPTNGLDESRRESARYTAVAEVSKLVYEYFDLSDWERALVEDTCTIFEPSSTPATVDADIRTLRPSQLEHRKHYAELLCRTINRWARRSKYALVPSAAIADREGLALLTLLKTSKSESIGGYHESPANAKIRSVIERVAKASVQDGLGGLRYLRGFALFESKQVHILKPLALRHWTRTAALNDADEMAGFISNMGQGG